MRARAYPLLFTVAIAASAGCQQVAPEERVDGWALARTALTGGEACFVKRSEYCIDDPALVDAAIKPRLTELYGGEMPVKKNKVDAIVKASIKMYKRALLEPANIARVEELIKERYASPRVEVAEGEVKIDMGVPPGHLEPVAATHNLRMGSSDEIEDGVWRDGEVHRVLEHYATSYPDLDRVTAIVTITTATGVETLSYQYLRSKGVVVITSDQGSAWTTRRFESWDQVSFRRGDLAQCDLPEGKSAVEACIDF